ncbi:uncharacterized protein LOC134839809 [Symsagittifera roscoffensis]|uniref:uncharacterized protein LOC134839809 n=1 Tax=Symsagittifera roscoffensis TaxID=84072 RepID=UPI00307B56AE
MSELRRFELLAETIYDHINWFPLDNNNDHIGDCCDYQVRQYNKEGRRKAGISPLSYFWKVTDFFSNRRLNWIYAKYIPAQCTNVILQVGFGPGSLIIQGHIAMSASFMFPFDMGRSPYYFQRNNIESQITFEWFKLVVISMDRSWVTQWNQSEAGMARIPVNIRDHPELLRIIRSRHDVTNEHTRGLEK